MMSNRLPSVASTISAYAAISFLIYGWTILVSLWKIPSWISTLTVWEIISIISYSLVIALVESILVLGALVGLAFVLPSKWFRDAFVVRGVSLAIILLGSAMIHLRMYADIDLREQFYASYRLWWLVTAAGAILLTWLLPKVNWIRVIVADLADRMTVFLYLLLPLSFLAMIVVAIRLIF